MSVWGATGPRCEQHWQQFWDYNSLRYCYKSSRWPNERQAAREYHGNTEPALSPSLSSSSREKCSVSSDFYQTVWFLWIGIFLFLIPFNKDLQGQKLPQRSMKCSSDHPFMFPSCSGIMWWWWEAPRGKADWILARWTKHLLQTKDICIFHIYFS